MKTNESDEWIDLLDTLHRQTLNARDRYIDRCQRRDVHAVRAFGGLAALYGEELISIALLLSWTLPQLLNFLTREYWRQFEDAGGGGDAQLH